MSNLVGTGLNQVPTNGMLGGLAYQSPDHASIKDLDLKNLSQINSEIADTAVDVFVYDTRKDSDGGAWRKRTQNTSWYNETLGTATRGTRREFPAVAVIVAEATKVTIYDGDDPDLPMWMVFNVSNSTWFKLHSSGSQCSCISALNATLCAGGNGAGIRLAVVDFIKDNQYLTEAGYTYYNNGIETRNDTTTFSDDGGSKSIAHNAVNDVVMTVLPNARIDSATGLPVPTIAVATNKGSSVIKDDGNVFDFNDTGNATRPATDIAIRGNDIVHWNVNNGTLQQFFNALTATADSLEEVQYNYTASGGHGTCENISALLRDSNEGPYQIATRDSKSIAAGAQSGMSVFVDGDDRNFVVDNHSIFDSRVAYITSDYNTGYMHGDIEGAFLSDIDFEDGVELISNGRFDTVTSGWTANGAGSAVTVNSGQAQLTNGGTTNASLDQTVTTVVGRTYEVSATITPQGGGPLPRLYAGNKYVQVGSDSNSAQTVTLLYTATSTSTIVSINANTNVDNAVTLVDNISMKISNDITDREFITNGTFDSNTDGWGAANGATLTQQSNGNPGGNINVASGSSSNGYASQTNTVAVGKYYILTFDHYHVNGSAGYVNIGTSIGGSQYIYHQLPTSSSWTSHSFTVKATDSTLFTGFYSRPNGNVRYDNISLKEAEPDRSLNNSGLGIYGTIIKTPVATGAELVAYSNFSGTNVLRQPPNSDMNLGTSDAYSMAWYKTTSSGNGQIVSYEGGTIGTDEYGKPFNIRMVGGKVTGWASHDNFSSWNTVYDSVDSNDGRWHCAVWVRSGTNFLLYRDGEGPITHWTSAPVNEVHNGGVGSNALSDSNTELVIGARKRGKAPGATDHQEPFDGSIALARIGKSAPSAAQIKKMYEDEKVLFQENAKATLYGSSDAVTALAYDDDTNLLHVGTSAGRSEFQGLCRINNTTTAVTTAISASNGLVTEQ